jgi:3-isopropylmalate dehydrogenase
VAMLLEWLGKRRGDPKLLKAGKKIVEATECTLADPSMRTRDIGGSMGTQEFGTHVAMAIGAG